MRGRGGPANVHTFTDLQEGASSARQVPPDEPPAEPLRRSARGRATGLAPVAQALTPAEQDARADAMGAVLQKQQKREASRTRAINQVVEQDKRRRRLQTREARRTKREREEAQREMLAEAGRALRKAAEEAELAEYEAQDVQPDEETRPVALGPVISGAANAGPRRSGRAPKQVVFTNMNGSGPRGSYDKQVRVDDGKQGGEEAVLEDDLVDRAPCGNPYSWATTVLWKNQRTGVVKVCFDFPHQKKQLYQQAGPEEDHIKFDRAWHEGATEQTEQEEPASVEEWYLLRRLQLPQNSGRVEGLYRETEGALVFKLKPVPPEAAGQDDKHQALTVKVKSPSKSTRDREEDEEGADWDMQANGIDPKLPSDEQDATWEDASDTSSEEGDYASEFEASDVDSDAEDEMEEDEDWQEAAAAFVAP